MWQIMRQAIAILYEVSSYDKNSGKPIWRSKTLWANALAITGLLTSRYAGIEIGADDQIAILGAVNVVMRLISKEETGLIERTQEVFNGSDKGF